jgi:hypothetical protein
MKHKGWLALLFCGLLVACGDDAESTSEADTASGRPQSGRDIGNTDEEDTGPGRDLPDVSDAGSGPDDAMVDTTDPGTTDTGAQDTASQDARPAPDVSPPRDSVSVPDTAPVDAGPTEVTPEVQQAMDAAEAASNATRDTFCGCYQSGDPYNGDEAACQAELDGISVSIISCDLTLAATWPDDALAFYECRRTVAESLDACFAACSSRSSAILNCVPSNAFAAVGCGDGRDDAFVAAYEACHP